VSAGGLDLALDDAQQALADALSRFCADRCPDAVVRAAAEGFPKALWRELAALGVLAIATPEGEGGAIEAVAAMEPLGRAAFPGPLATTFVATQLLPAPERARVAAGEVIAAVGSPPLVPWAPEAGVFVEPCDGGAWLAGPAGPVEPVATLGGEPWGRVALVRRAPLGDAADVARARALGDLVLAAWLAAAGRRLVEDAAAHARARRQFGRPIAEFQAVSHPLADCAIALDAAATLARVGAFHWDAARRSGTGGGSFEGAGRYAAAARLSASRAALRAARVAHQTFGAQGVTVAGPAFHVSRAIRQLVASPPGPEPARTALLAGLGLS
jgi:alkylation response protein AidB-like acyl-CoA dehydrogenase